MTVMKAVVELGAECGESPIWDASAGVLWWTDTASNNVYSYDPATRSNSSYLTDRTVRAVALAGGGNLILVAADGIFLWKPGDSTSRLVCDPERGRTGMLPNDGTVDTAGRFLFDTFDSAVLDNPAGSLYSVSASGVATVLDTGLRLPNGMALSPDGTALYLAEMFAGRILRYDYDVETGQVSGKAVFAELSPESGLPDGLIVDAEGFVWNAHWAGWRMTRYAPDGRVDRVLKLPFATATCMGFGGNDRADLYVTTARAGLSEEDLGASLSPGGLFVLAGAGKGIAEGICRITI